MRPKPGETMIPQVLVGCIPSNIQLIFPPGKAKAAGIRKMRITCQMPGESSAKIGLLFVNLQTLLDGTLGHLFSSPGSQHFSDGKMGGYVSS